MRGVGVMRDGRWILRDINWTVPVGSLSAILGPNGSGKSTLARIAACHLWPTAGECTVLGGRFGQANLPELRRRIRLVQPAGPYDVDPALTAREVVLTGYFGSIGLYHEADRKMNAQAQAPSAADGACGRGGSSIRIAQQRRTNAQPDCPGDRHATGPVDSR